MSRVGRLCGALAVPLVLSAAAEAQIGGSAPVATGLGMVPIRTGLPGFRMAGGDLREGRWPSRNGLVATLPVADNLDIGVGRFAVLEVAGRRTNIELERRPTDMRRRERAIAAVAFSFSF